MGSQCNSTAENEGTCLHLFFFLRRRKHHWRRCGGECNAILAGRREQLVVVECERENSGGSRKMVSLSIILGGFVGGLEWPETEDGRKQKNPLQSIIIIIIIISEVEAELS